MQKLFLVSLNDRVRSIKPGIIAMLTTIKQESKGNLFADLKLISNYVLPKLNTLAAIEQQLSELNQDYTKVKTEKQSLDDELKKKIGEITGLTEKINEKVKEIAQVKADLETKNNALDELKLELKGITDELNSVKLEKQKLLNDRIILIDRINTQISKLGNNNLHTINNILEIPQLLVDIVKHLKETNSNDEKIFKLINLICSEFFNKFTDITLNKEITKLEDIDQMLQQINNEILIKVDLIESMLIKYSDLFSSNLLFEEKISKLDDLLENYNLLNNFKNDVQSLLS